MMEDGGVPNRMKGWKMMVRGREYLTCSSDNSEREVKERLLSGMARNACVSRVLAPLVCPSRVARPLFPQSLYIRIVHVEIFVIVVVIIIVVIIVVVVQTIWCSPTTQGVGAGPEGVGFGVVGREEFRVRGGARRKLLVDVDMLCEMFNYM